MELTKEDLLKELAKQGALGIRRLIKIGDSYGITIPITWIKFNCAEIDGNYYFKLHVEDNSLIFTAVTDEDLEGISVRRKSG